jgi:hypothetical protein
MRDDFRAVAEIGGEPVALGEAIMFAREAGNDADAVLSALAPYIVCRRELKARGDERVYGEYKAFWDAWQTENARRKQAARDGEIIYGPEWLSQRVFYDYAREADMARLEELMSSPSDEAELRAAYDERTDLFALMGAVNMRVTLLSLDDGKEVADRFKAALADGESYDGAAARLGLAEKTYRRVFGADDFRNPDVTRFDGVADAIIGLPAGEFADPIDNAGQGWIILYCESREGAGRRDFDDCREELSLILAEERFEADFERLVESADIKAYDELRESLAAE